MDDRAAEAVARGSARCDRGHSRGQRVLLCLAATAASACNPCALEEIDEHARVVWYDRCNEQRAYASPGLVRRASPSDGRSPRRHRRAAPSACPPVPGGAKLPLASPPGPPHPGAGSSLILSEARSARQAKPAGAVGEPALIPRGGPAHSGAGARRLSGNQQGYLRSGYSPDMNRTPGSSVGLPVVSAHVLG